MLKLKKKSCSVLGEIAGIIETALISIFIITLIFTYFLRVSTIQGDSMKNTLMPDDRIISLCFFGKPQTGDIVIINADEAVLADNDGTLIHNSGLNKQIVKRVIAVGGQTVDIDFEKGFVYVDGVLQNEPYITELTHLDEGSFTGMYPITVPDNYVFVMGDNRNVSKDSRSLSVGFVSEDNIVGKVFFRIFPLSEFGTVS